MGKAKEAQCAVTTPMKLPLPAQAKWTALQGSLQHKVAHLPRVARKALVVKAVTDTADAVADAALAIGHCQVQPDSDEHKRARVQLQLPIRHGGMGRRRLSPAEGSAAFLSSAALANVGMTGAPGQFGPFDGLAGAGLRQEWSQLRTHEGPTPTERWLMTSVLPYLCSVAQDACVVSWLEACTVAWLGSCSLRLAPRCWPGFSYACEPSVVSCSSF